MVYSAFLTQLICCLCFLLKQGNTLDGTDEKHYVMTSQREEHVRHKRTAVAATQYLWPEATVPYVLSAKLEGNRRAQAAISQAIEHWHQRSCIRFINVTDDQASYNNTKYLQFVDAIGCHSSVGRGSGTGPQSISVGPGCAFTDKLIHELGHLVGLWHEHARLDRDNNVVIMWNNIEQGMERNFVKMPIMRLLSPYDLSSMMHYDMNTFSVNGEPTIRPFDKRLAFLIGHREDLSFYDTHTVNELYQCSRGCGKNAPSCDNEGFLTENCTCYCPTALNGTSCNSVITSQDCGGVVYVDEETVFTSPGYPDNYLNNIKCTWLFKSKTNTFMSLEFDFLELEKTSSGHCRDQLEIRYHHIGISQGPVFCSNMTETINTTTNRLIITMRTNSFGTDRGFRVNIKTYRITDCSQFPCENGGTCIDIAAIRDYMCYCQDSWVGHNCHIPIQHGRFSEWSAWSSCTSECGVRSRYRTCDNPVPQNGGRPCSGHISETVRCATADICKDAFFCDFGTSGSTLICDMYQEEKDDGDWLLGKGKTPSLETGPLSGHTEGHKEDMYIYLEGSVMDSGDKTLFWLPTENHQFGSYCLEFFYTLYGENVATLAVMRRWKDTQRLTALWQRSGDRGQEWHKANVNVLLYKNVQIGFLGIRGGGFDSDIAIDDISISPGRCISKNTQYGCPWEGGRRLPLGRFSYSRNCKESTCFCNQDGYLDCPQWMTKDICMKPPVSKSRPVGRTREDLKPQKQLRQG